MTSPAEYVRQHGAEQHTFARATLWLPGSHRRRWEAPELFAALGVHYSQSTVLTAYQHRPCAAHIPEDGYRRLWKCLVVYRSTPYTLIHAE